MKVFLFHCWGGDGKSCWSSWLCDYLGQKKIPFLSPDFPDTNTPNLEKWLSSIRNINKKFNEKDEWMFVGHSLGCPTILRLLESFGPDEHVKKVVLVAGFAKDLGIPEIRNFVQKEFDWEKIKSKCDEFVVISSDNDPFIPLEEGERLAKLLNARFIVEKNTGHLNGFSCPRLIEVI
jgi:predicted alpha/beta hydrolase family esterase